LAQTPEGSAKVLLKISVTAPVAKDYTFQFTSLKNLQEREAIKAQIGELLARARGLSSASAVGTPAPITPSSAAASPSPSTPQSANNISSPATMQQQAATNNMARPLPSSPAPGSPSKDRQDEFNDRRHLIKTSREVQTLHKELVMVERSVSEEEFWSSPYVKRIRQVKQKHSDHNLRTYSN
jgi:transcription initiation factor TFIIH subunit 1